MQVIYGIHPILESLKSGGEGIERIIIARGKKNDPIKEILFIAGEKGIAVKYDDRAAIDRLAAGKRHQGIVCLCTEFIYTPLEEIISQCTHSESGGLILILDSILDPQNLGSLIRSGHCFGAKGIVIPKNRAAPVTPTVIKASAGSAGHTVISRVVNIGAAIDALKKEGFWIYGADIAKGQDTQNFDYHGRVGLVLGSEGAGLRPLVKGKCDFLVTMPMVGRIDSLNVSVAGGILMYEIMRNRYSRISPNIL